MGEIYDSLAEGRNPNEGYGLKIGKWNSQDAIEMLWTLPILYPLKN